MIDEILAYHEASKHHYRAFAPGPGTLDWANQPDPFRRYAGAALVPLAASQPEDQPPYEAGFRPGIVSPAPLDFDGVSRLFFDSLALSAWKEFQGTRWSLRVNPSSGNLHPTEGYLMAGPLPGLCETPIVAHYAPAEHALEVRARLSDRTWHDLREGVVREPGEGLPEQTILIGLTSIHWREAWKYGERAYRYCQHDVGHALACLGIAAAGLGWEARLLDGPGSDQLAVLLGVADPAGAEPEEPDCLVAVYPQGEPFRHWRLPESAVEIFRPLAWQGRPNTLSRVHVDWRWVSAAAEVAAKPGGQGSEVGPAKSERGSGQRSEVGGQPRERRAGFRSAPRTTGGVQVRSQPRERQAGFRSESDRGASSDEWAGGSGSLRRIIHRRRSAVAMDGQTWLERDAFFRMLLRTMPGPGAEPFALLPWPPHVHLALFVHRVRGLDPGIYFLVRDPVQADALRGALRADFAWEPPPGCPAGLPLYHLAAGDARSIARRISCGQDIASDGCFSLGMLAGFEGPIEEHGAWFYPRLFWECGMIGQVLYLEAEAAGVRGTGIGCFFDDGMHSLLGLRDRQYQSLYHFTVGGPLDDPRLTTLPAYGRMPPNVAERAAE